MLQVDENTLYSLAELEKRLEGIVALPTLLDRLGLRDRRVFRDALWGWEILDAARRAEPFSGADPMEPGAGMLLMQPARGRGRKPASKEGAVHRLRAKDLE